MDDGITYYTLLQNPIPDRLGHTRAFKSEGIKVKKLPFRSPNLNAYSERWVQTVQNECLNHFMVFGERHLEYLLRECLSD